MDRHDAIVRHPSPVLRRASRAVGFPDAAVLGLGRAMEAVMDEAGGVGLAGVQVGVHLRLFVARLPGLPPGLPPLLVDPVIEWSSPEEAVGTEGCLSIPGRRFHVARSAAIRLAFTAADGSPRRIGLHGFDARIAQHEIDHLDGVLVIDREFTAPLGPLAGRAAPQALGQGPEAPYIMSGQSLPGQGAGSG